MFFAFLTNTPNDLALLLSGLICGAMMLLMQAGFALNEAGLTRAKNAANIMLRSFANVSVGGVMFWAVGFGLMFGASNGVTGSSLFILNPAGADSPRLPAFWLQQAMCAATAGAIVFGATAERMRFAAAVAFSAVMATLIYPMAGHWVWGNLLVAGNTATGAWLARQGFVDFAGSAVVHCTGGFAALAAAMAVGPRLGKFARDGSVRLIAGHNLTLASLGVLILMFGWFGFVGASALSTGSGAVVGRAVMNTALAAFAGAATSMLTAWVRFRKPDITMTLNGALAGLAAISAGCATMYPAFALFVGAAAGVLVVFAVVALDSARVDDPVGAISVHGICGAFGTVAAGVLHEAAFDGRGWNVFEHFATQCIGVAAIFVWSFGVTFLVLKGIDLVVNVRVSAQDEMAGLDVSEHGATAYHAPMGTPLTATAYGSPHPGGSSSVYKSRVALAPPAAH